MFEVPRPSFVEKVLRNQRAHRADVHHVSAPFGLLQPFIEEGVNHRTVPAVHHREQRVLFYLVHEAHAAGAHHATIPVEEDVPSKVVPPQNSLGVAPTTVLSTLGEHEVLEVTLPRLITYGTVEWVIQQIELEHAAPHTRCVVALGSDHLPVCDRGRAGRKQLRCSLHLDQAHSAHGRG